MRRASGRRTRVERWMVARALPSVALVLLAAGCGDDRTEADGELAPYIPGEIAAIERELWRTSNGFGDGPEFSDDELRCIDRVGVDVPPAELEASAGQRLAESTRAVQTFKATMYEECLTDEHLERDFARQLVRSSTTEYTGETLRCMSRRLVRLMRGHGFEELFLTRSEATGIGFIIHRTACGLPNECWELAVSMESLVSSGDIPSLSDSERDDVAALVDAELEARCSANDAGG